MAKKKMSPELDMEVAIRNAIDGGMKKEDIWDVIENTVHTRPWRPSEKAMTISAYKLMLERVWKEKNP